MSIKTKVIFCALIMFIGSVFAAPNAKADALANYIVISQVQIEGDNAAGDEFVEIYNPGSSCVVLDGWSLQYKSSTGNFPLGSKKALPKIILPPQSYYLIAGSQYNAAVAGDLTNSSFSLSGNSAGATVFLASTTDAISGGEDINIVDKFAYGTSVENSPLGTAITVPSTTEKPAADWSFKRTGYTGSNATDFVVQASSPNNFVPSAAEKTCEAINPPPAVIPTTTPETTATTTPDTENASSTPERITKSEMVKIYRFLPNPSGEDSGTEWVELQNQDSVEVDLTGWYLDDKNIGTGPGSDAYVLSGAIAAGEIKRFTLPAEVFALNNSGGDEVNLYFSDKSLSHSAPYSATAYDDGIFEFRDGVWQPPTLNTGGGGGGSSGGTVSAVSYLGTSQFKLNEIFSNPAGDDGGGEWVEIFNSANSTGSLNGYYLADGETDEWSAGAYVINTATTVPPHGWALVRLPKNSLTLNNSGKEKVKLFSAQKQLVDFVEYADAAENRAWAKIQDGKWQYQIPTPGADNNLIPELPRIFISEILPAPLAEQEEFIELFNNSTTTADLGGLVLKIGARSKTFDTAASLPAMAYMVLYSDDLPAALRNNGETIALYDIYGRTIFSVSYPKAQAGESYARTEAGSYFWTGSPSPGEANVVVLAANTAVPESPPIISVSKPVTVPKSTSDYNKLNRAYSNLELKVAMLEQRINELSLNNNNEDSGNFVDNQENLQDNNAPKSSAGAYKYLVLTGSSLVILIGIGRKHLSGFFKKNLD